MTITFDYAQSSGGARICYVEEAGPGVPLLFVLNTGFPPGSVLSNYSGSLNLHRGIAGGAGWYMFDWRGCGRSTAPQGPVVFADLVDDLEAVAEAIGRPFDLNAVNDGCGMALAFAVRRPDLLRRLLLVAPQGPTDREFQQRVRSAETTELIRVSNMARYLMWVHPGTDPAESADAAKRAVAGMPYELGTELLAVAATADLLEIGAAVTVPTLVLHTEGDADLAIELAALMPSAKAANWIKIGDGTINGAAWRQAWDDAFPPSAFACERPDRDEPKHLGLSPREAEIFALVCRGLSNAEIGEALVIAPSTAKRHVANIFAKLGVTSRPQAIALAYESGIVPAPTSSLRA